MYYLGIDVGSSSIKVALVEINSGKCAALAQEPEKEMPITAKQKGWAEQRPEDWWSCICKGIKKIRTEHNIATDLIKGVGIAYQMHGLVVVDDMGNSLRESIIWCDSRAVAIGDKAYKDLGESYCDAHLLNSPANFTASKLKWVQKNEPDIYKQVAKCMLPGDYIAFRFSGKINTTVSGLSEGVFWDFGQDKVSASLLSYYNIDSNLLPNVVDTFGQQSLVSEKGATESGLPKGTPILYRAGDQPNNALSLNVFQHGEVAVTGGTSGVIYAVSERGEAKETYRMNNFAHVNYKQGANKYIGKLLCINGAGIQYRWLLNNLSVDSYADMNALAENIPVGADGLTLIPFGNGTERMFHNKNLGTRIVGLDLNRHHKGHLCRAALEGIAFSFVHGMEIMEADGVRPKTIRAGNDNLFQARIFSETVSTMLDRGIELYNTTGAIGAARACAIGSGAYKRFTSYLEQDHIRTFYPSGDKKPLEDAYQNWKKELELILKEN